MLGFYLRLPLIFIKFWFYDALKEIIGFFASLNSAFLKLFSLSLLIRTYFKPWKGEFRKGLVGFSIGMGMFIKTFMILVDLILLVFIIGAELSTLILFISLPILALILPFL